MSHSSKTVDPISIENSILMLKQHVGGADIAPLLAILQALAEDPHNNALIEELTAAFEGLGILQGAVLTYAPCIAILISKNPFNDPD